MYVYIYIYICIYVYTYTHIQFTVHVLLQCTNMFTFPRQVQYNHTITMSTATKGSRGKLFVGVTYDEVMEIYDNWASNDYEQVSVGVTAPSSILTSDTEI